MLIAIYLIDFVVRFNIWHICPSSGHLMSEESNITYNT